MSISEQDLVTYCMTAGMVGGITVALAVWLLRIVESLFGVLMNHLEHRRSAARRRAKLDATREAQPAL